MPAPDASVAGLDGFAILQADVVHHAHADAFAAADAFIGVDPQISHAYESPDMILIDGESSALWTRSA
jgi:hypothetical protein